MNVSLTVSLLVTEGSCESSSSAPPPFDAHTTESVSDLVDVDKYETTEQVAKALIEFLVTRYVRSENY